MTPKYESGNSQRAVSLHKKILMFPDMDLPSKKHAHEKGKFFYLIPMDIIYVIDLWIVGIEHRKTFTAVMVQVLSSLVTCNSITQTNTNGIKEVQRVGAQSMYLLNINSSESTKQKLNPIKTFCTSIS